MDKTANKGRAAREVRVARTLKERLQGLMFSKQNDVVLVLPRCRDIHTFGMRRSIDVAFLDSRGQVVDSYRNVAPGCRIRSPMAAMAVERPANRMGGWYRSGAFVEPQILDALKKG